MVAPAVVSLFECKKSKKSGEDEIRVKKMNKRCHPMPQGVHVLARKRPKKEEDMKRQDDNCAKYQPIFQNGRYVEERVIEAEGTVPAIFFAILPHATEERLVWLRFENKKTNKSFDAVPVVIRIGQKFGIVFLDAMHRPFTSLCTLREITHKFIWKAREYFNSNNGKQMMTRPTILTMYVAILPIKSSETTVVAPGFHHFVRCGRVCVRPVTPHECKEYLHFYNDESRQFHLCMPNGLTFKQVRDLKLEFKHQCPRGPNRWIGTSSLPATYAPLATIKSNCN